ncbi:hypothetical protein [Polaribacter dokdonensis]|uniref:Uncharacterized protein n=1 Tax=Polaribacter dokdonensis DSW-5 TaxID=1300348 RepID=A0A0M9CI10_9FLAO|nr:hypothetical protein [Polaribacter dokdonensis]KOY52942.1 hypothetical protein I602_2502 [Polaribacter dokdonensis DSW-5]SEE54793.1 hypothetical protein SAMN05444353_2276 [Polaribacter dokdonensis DSW-5]
MENEIRNSENFINSKLRNKKPFSTPDNYFDSLEDRFSAKLAEDKFSKENPFKVSDTYFENLEDDIFAKIVSEKKEVKVISLKDRLFKVIPFAAAASVVLFLGLNTFNFSTENTASLDSLSDDDIEYWLDSNTLHTSDIASVLEEDILDENAFYFADIEDESIEDYINTDDNSYLLNELKE